jgi:hypothetical protein
MLGRLNSMLQTATDPEARARSSAQRRGLAVDVACPDGVASGRFGDTGLAMLRRGDFRQFETLHQKCFDGLLTLSNGQRQFAVLEDQVSSQFRPGELSPVEAEARLVAFEAAWTASKCSPFMAALYGIALANTGYCYRGTEVAGNVSQSGWDMLHSYNEQAHDVFLMAADRCADSPFWHRALYSIGLADGCSPEQLARRFERALVFDSCDIDIHTNRAYQLLPRWHGSFAELEQFAKASVVRTRAELGTSIYARIYASLTSMEVIPSTKANWPKLKQGYEDWLSLVPNQWVMNSYANMANAFDDNFTLHQILTKRMTEYHPSAWDGPEQAEWAFDHTGYY